MFIIGVVSLIVMDGITAWMNGAFSLAEPTDTDVSFIVDLGGFYTDTAFEGAGE